MTIDFPCLQKDISFWFPTNADDVARGIEKNLNLTEEEDNAVVAQPKSNIWLDNGNNNISNNGDYCNIMSPVLKDTPTSVWLAGKTQEGEKEEKKTREADLTTSIWLASSSSEQFTCVTKATTEAAAIEWPEILFQTSPGTWLANQRVERNDIDQWLANKTEVKREENNQESLLDNWIKIQGDSSKVWMVQEDHSDYSVVSEFHESWIAKANDLISQESSPAKKLRMQSNEKWLSASESSSMFQGMESSTSSLVDLPVNQNLENRSESYIEKWLCLATSDEDEMIDDESSIAILSFGEQADNDNDFDMIEDEALKQQQKESGSFWLFG